MAVLVPLFLAFASLGAISLGIFLLRKLTKTLETGVIGTMRGKIYRTREPFQYWLLVAMNSVFVLMAFSFPLIVAVRFNFY
jgi:hypothetical protein